HYLEYLPSLRLCNPVPFPIRISLRFPDLCNSDTSRIPIPSDFVPEAGRTDADAFPCGSRNRTCCIRSVARRLYTVFHLHSALWCHRVPKVELPDPKPAAIDPAVKAEQTGLIGL